MSATHRALVVLRRWPGATLGIVLAVGVLLGIKSLVSDSTDDLSSPPEVAGGHGSGGSRFPAGTPASDAEAAATAAYRALPPEQVLQDILRVRSEPFAPAVLDQLAALLGRLSPESDRLAAAALLHRYRRPEGTHFLRARLSGAPGSPAALSAATALALARDRESIGPIRDSLKDYLLDREFTRAAAAWADPALLDRAAELARAPEGPFAEALALLVIGRDPRAGTDAGLGPGLDGILAAEPKASRLPYLATAAALGRTRAEPVLEALQEAVRVPERHPGGWEDAVRVLGRDRGLPLVRAACEHYALVRREFATAYRRHARGVADGTRGIPDLPAYPSASETRLLEAVRLAREWKDPETIEPVARALRASRQARHSPRLSRTLISAVLWIDPARGRSHLAALGVSADEIETANRINELLPLPLAQLPEERGLALTHAAPVDGED